MTDEQLAEIEGRCKRATPGPWREGTCNVWNDELVIPVASTERHTFEAGTRKGFFEWKGDTPEREQADSEFIAHARQDIPLLLAEVRRLREAAG